METKTTVLTRRDIVNSSDPELFDEFVGMTFGDQGRPSQLTTAVEGNKRGMALLVENSGGFRERNVIEINLDNTGVGATDQILYIGGLAALAGQAELFGLPAGAQDNAVITDQYGIGCKFTQGLSLMVNKGVYIYDFQVLADVDNAPQLREPIVRRRIFFNGDNTPITLPAAVTFDMSDNRKNMMKDSDAFFFLNDLNWLEYKIKAGFAGSILFQVKAADLSAIMNIVK